MNDTNYQEMVKKAVQDKFKGKKTIPGKVVPRYPISAEREYVRINRQYMRILQGSLKEHLPELMAVYKAYRYDDGEYRLDDFMDVRRKLREIITSVAEDIEKKLAEYKLSKRIERVGRIAHKRIVKEWLRTIKKTIGIDVPEEYYEGDMYEQQVRKWIADNVLKIKSLPQETLGELQKILEEGFRENKPIWQIQQEIQKNYHISKRHAEMLARDQMSTLNAQITRMQQEDAGVSRYKWKTMHDSIVRECHASFDGRIFEWSNPPEIWYRTRAGIVMTGRRCHPGEDYACRCVAVPVFDSGTINLPMR